MYIEVDKRLGENLFSQKFLELEKDKLIILYENF